MKSGGRGIVEEISPGDDDDNDDDDDDDDYDDNDDSHFYSWSGLQISIT